MCGEAKIGRGEGPNFTQEEAQILCKEWLKFGAGGGHPNWVRGGAQISRGETRPNLAWVDEAQISYGEGPNFRAGRGPNFTCAEKRPKFHMGRDQILCARKCPNFMQGGAEIGRGEGRPKLGAIKQSSKVKSCKSNGTQCYSVI